MKSFSLKKKSDMKPKHRFFEEGEDVNEELMGVAVGSETSTSNESENDLKDLGCVYAEQGRAGEALTCFQRAITISPSNHLLYELKAQVLLSEGCYLDAIQSCKMSIELNPDWSESHHTIARCFREFGEIYSSLNSMQKAMQLDPDSAEIKLELAEIEELTRRADATRFSHSQFLNSCLTPEEHEVKRCFMNLATRASVLSDKLSDTK